jgi:hypothetical protein
MSLTTVTLNGDQGQSHAWTGVADRPNSDAGTEGMLRSLYEYRDAFGPNELVAPIAVIYEYPEPAATDYSWIVPPAVPVVPIVPPPIVPPTVPGTMPPWTPPGTTPEAVVPEPSAAVLMTLGVVGIVLLRRVPGEWLKAVLYFAGMLATATVAGRIFG